MEYRCPFSGGIARSNGSPAGDALMTNFIRIGQEMADQKKRASIALQKLGVKAEHPDDGWVDRQNNKVHLSYPRFDHGPCVGDLIALGSPWEGYRLCEVTDLTGGVFMRWFWFKELRRLPAIPDGAEEFT
jgi:hypothetical protein